MEMFISDMTMPSIKEKDILPKSIFLFSFSAYTDEKFLNVCFTANGNPKYKAAMIKIADKDEIIIVFLFLISTIKIITKSGTARQETKKYYNRVVVLRSLGACPA